MQELPIEAVDLPGTQPNGDPLKPITQTILQRRATQHFQSDPIPAKYLNAILRLGSQAPSGYNLQPWRFIVVQDVENRKRLQTLARNQPKVGEAPVVIITIGMKEQYKAWADEVFREGARRGASDPKTVEKTEESALAFLSTFPADVWVTKHVMIAFTTMMWAAEAYGFDTAPMEGFDRFAVQKELGIPEEAEVIAMLAMGRGKGPEKAYPGRLDLERLVFNERYGQLWQGENA